MSHHRRRLGGELSDDRMMMWALPMGALAWSGWAVVAGGRRRLGGPWRAKLIMFIPLTPGKRKFYS